MLYTDYLEHYGVKGMKWDQRKRKIAGKIKRPSKQDIEKALNIQTVTTYHSGRDGVYPGAGKKKSALEDILNIEDETVYNSNRDGVYPDAGKKKEEVRNIDNSKNLKRGRDFLKKILNK